MAGTTRGGLGPLLIGGAIGAALAYFLDPSRGASRRNKTVDQFGSKFGQASSSAASTAGYTAGQVQGVMRENVPHRRDNPNPDDLTLRDRIESEIFRDPKTSRQEMNIDVVDGVVELRGELPSQSAIDDLIARVKNIPDVKGVTSYLHLPGTPAPNKESAIQAS